MKASRSSLKFTIIVGISTALASVVAQIPPGGSNPPAPPCLSLTTTCTAASESPTETYKCCYDKPSTVYPYPVHCWEVWEKNIICVTPVDQPNKAGKKYRHSNSGIATCNGNGEGNCT